MHESINEEVYLKDYETVRECREGLSAYLGHYNEERVHQALDYHTPAELYRGIYRLKD
jgi:putative transposase